MFERHPDESGNDYRFSLDVADRLAASDFRIVITGARGWLGRATLELLSAALGTDFDRRVVCFGSAAGSVSLANRAIPQQPLAALADLPRAPTAVLHGAFLTKDRAETMDGAVYLTENRALRTQVLRALDAIGTQSLFLPSSGAAREADNPAASEAMRLYGALKREDEELFSDWATRAGATCIIARIFNLSGPYINKLGNYALASFILDALARRPIEVRARRSVVRSYVAIRELMSVVFGLLLEGQRGVERFDAAGSEVVEVRELAQLVANLIGDGSVAAAMIDPATTGDIYVGDQSRYKVLGSLLGVAPVPLDVQIVETARSVAVTQRNDHEVGRLPFEHFRAAGRHRCP